ncbi:hypothetical protein Tco_0037583, partial [Tanacetum coccineum]
MNLGSAGSFGSVTLCHLLREVHVQRITSVNHSVVCTSEQTNADPSAGLYGSVGLMVQKSRAILQAQWSEVRGQRSEDESA